MPPVSMARTAVFNCLPLDPFGFVSKLSCAARSHNRSFLRKGCGKRVRQCHDRSKLGDERAGSRDGNRLICGFERLLESALGQSAHILRIGSLLRTPFRRAI